MITGFKVDFPGAINKYGVEPDFATWGKGVGNGFSFCALTGKKEYMELGGIRREGEEKLFLISTTCGGETHAIAAGLAVIDIFKREPVIAHNQAIGDRLIRGARQEVARLGLDQQVDVYPCNWFPVLTFKDRTGQVCNAHRTLVMQEMIRRGVLFQSAFTPSYSHTNEDVDFFNGALGESLTVYKRALEEGVEKFLVGPAAKPVFRKIL
jgi:glutamate-1-semialdehyde aminotransferase